MIQPGNSTAAAPSVNRNGSPAANAPARAAPRPPARRALGRPRVESERPADRRDSHPSIPSAATLTCRDLDRVHGVGAGDVPPFPVLDHSVAIGPGNGKLSAAISCFSELRERTRTRDVVDAWGTDVDLIRAAHSVPSDRWARRRLHAILPRVIRWVGSVSLGYPQVHPQGAWHLCWGGPRLTGLVDGQRSAWKASTIELGMRPRSDTS